MNVMQMIKEKKQQFVAANKIRDKETFLNQQEELKAMKIEREQLLGELEMRQNAAITKQDLKQMKRQNFELKHPHVTRFLQGARERVKESRRNSSFGIK
jgi:hypothetical protein